MVGIFALNYISHIEAFNVDIFQIKFCHFDFNVHEK